MHNDMHAMNIYLLDTFNMLFNKKGRLYREKKHLQSRVNINMKENILMICFITINLNHLWQVIQ